MGSHCWWWGPGYFFGAPWNMALGALFWIGLVALVIWAVKHSQPRSEQPSSALRILEERYARGEISDDEFANRKRALGAGT